VGKRKQTIFKKRWFDITTHVAHAEQEDEPEKSMEKSLSFFFFQEVH
jgi:hypothetical protein